MAKSVENVVVDSFELIKENYAKFLLMYLVIAVVNVLVLLVFVAFFVLALGGSIALGNVVPIAVVIILGVFVLFLISPIWIGAYYYLTLQWLDGKRVSIYDAISMAKRRYVDFLFTLLLQTLIFVVVSVIIFLPLISSVLGLLGGNIAFTMHGISSLGPVIKIILIALIVFVVFLIVMSILMPLLYEALPLVVLENVGGVNAIRRSVEIGRANFWKLIWLFTVFWFAISMIYVGEWVASAIFGMFGHVIGIVISIILSLVVGALVTVWSYALPIVFYREFVNRKKG